MKTVAEELERAKLLREQILGDLDVAAGSFRAEVVKFQAFLEANRTLHAAWDASIGKVTGALAGAPASAEAPAEVVSYLDGLEAIRERARKALS